MTEAQQPTADEVPGNPVLEFVSQWLIVNRPLVIPKVLPTDHLVDQMGEAGVCAEFQTHGSQELLAAVTYQFHFLDTFCN